MLNDDFKIANISFPDQLAPDSVKKSKEYGLSVGKAIESEWFYDDRSNNKYLNNKSKYKWLGLYIY